MPSSGNLRVGPRSASWARCVNEPLKVGDRCVVCVRPENIALDAAEPVAGAQRVRGQDRVRRLPRATRCATTSTSDRGITFKVDMRDPLAPRGAADGHRGAVRAFRSARRWRFRRTDEAATRAGRGLGFTLIWAFLIVFVFYPLTRIFYDAFTNEAGQFTLANFYEFFTDSFYLRSLWKSLVLGVAAVVTTSVVGIAVAFLIIRYDFPYRNLFSYLTMLPMILPPLVGVLGFVFILGRAGTVNVLLLDWFGLQHPINFMYGVHGVLLVETVHLFPMMTLSILDALARVDPSLEEAAQGHGRQRLAPVLGRDAAAHHARLHLRRAARLHLDVRRFRHAAGRSACRICSRRRRT